MKVYMKIFVFWGITFSSMFLAQNNNHTEEDKFFVNSTSISKEYGIKDANGNWTLKPDDIGKLFDYELNLKDKDSVSVFYNGKYYKNSNIFLGNKYGLNSNQGKVLVPDIYDYLICQKGTCAASVDKKTYIIDYHNNKKTETFDGNVKDYRDSLLILEQKQNNYYVKNLRSGKLDGPFYDVKILEKKNIYYTGSSNERAFHKLNGELILSSDDIYYLYDDNFFADDVYIAYRNPKKFFKNLQGKTFAIFDDIKIRNGEFFEVCPQTQNGGDYRYCNDLRTYSIFDILNGLGEIYNVNGNYYNDRGLNFPESRYDPKNVPPVSIIKKDKKYAFANTKGEIISEFYLVLSPSFSANEDTFYFEKNENGKNIKGIIENGKETLKTYAKTVSICGNQMLIFDKEQNQYKIISKDREITIKDTPLPLKFVGLPFESQVYTFTTSNLFFTVDSKGKLQQTPFQQLSNFHKGYAFASKNAEEVLIVNEKLKVIKRLSNLKFTSNNLEIDPNGNLVFENKDSDHQVLINYKGEVIIDKNDTTIERTNNYLYHLYDNSSRVDTFVNKDGKPLYDYGEERYNSKIFRRKNYFYIMVNTRNNATNFYFFDNFGNFLGKDLPLYKQPLKEY